MTHTSSLPLVAANYVDVYEIKAKTLKHIQSGSVVPSGE